MEARQVDALPEDAGWQFEPKWDGFRCLAFRSGGDVALRSKSGKDLGRYFPEMVAALAASSAKDIVLDGELVIPLGSVLSFEALQMRLHPAESRIRRLAAETPSVFIAFDLLAADGDSLLAEPLVRRRELLEALFPSVAGPSVRLSPFSRDRREAARWLRRAGGGALDGVVAKRLDGPYEPGERAMLKIKCLRSADCVVGGFRYASAGDVVGSLLLGLHDEEGLLHHVGFTSGIPDRERPALTRRLEALRGEGFTGAAPGGPSRWSTERSAEWVPLRPELVAEVRYDHVTGDRFRHGTRFLRWRPDKAPRQCTMDQLRQEARPARLTRLLGLEPAAAR
jgi:ATP-dependent DNA ligase